MNRYQVKIDDSILPDSYTFDELINNGLLDDYDEHIKVRLVGESLWLIARDYPYDEKEGSKSYIIDEYGQIVRTKPVGINLSISNKDLHFNDSRSTQTIIVTSSKSWHISLNPATWVHLTNNGTSLSILVDDNYSSESRTDYFKIKSGDKEERINIYQSGCSTSSSGSTSGSTKSDNDNSGCIWVIVGIVIVLLLVF